MNVESEYFDEFSGKSKIFNINLYRSAYFTSKM
jgi:hypothetical protein